MTDHGRSAAGHLTDQPGRCRFAISPQDMAPPRTGAHPRDPRPKVRAHPSADASGIDVEQFEEVENEEDHTNEPGASSVGPIPRQERGPGTSLRERRTFTDAGVGPTRLPDWTRFHVPSSRRSKFILGALQ